MKVWKPSLSAEKRVDAAGEFEEAFPDEFERMMDLRLRTDKATIGVKRKERLLDLDRPEAGKWKIDKFRLRLRLELNWFWVYVRIWYLNPYWSNVPD